MKDYFYNLLYKYVSLYIRPENTFIEIDPRNPYFIRMFSPEKAAFFSYSKDISIYGYRRICEKYEAINENYDYFVLNGNLHYEKDIHNFLIYLHTLCNSNTRIIVTYYSMLWKLAFRMASFLGIREKTPEQNWITHHDLDNFFHLSGFETVRRDHRVLFPFKIPYLSDFINRYLAPLPFFRLFTILNIAIARPIISNSYEEKPSVSIIVPARNEAGNIEELVRRTPKMGPDDELIFIEGHSMDHTWSKIQEVKKKYESTCHIKIARQKGKGKGDAVRLGTEIAEKEIVTILDADMTVPPEELCKFYDAYISSKGEFINGSRLVYPLEKRAMRFFNILGNKFFAIMFSFILGQKIKDTLCGTKMMGLDKYHKLSMHRSYFGDFDPFGDFDLIFGSARLSLKFVEVPIRYRARTYGNTNIQRWKHGAILLKMLIFGANKIKFI